MRILT